jgi:dimethylamine monooxygenase subunit A
LSQLESSGPRFAPYRWAGADFQVGLRPIKPEQWILMDAAHGEVMRQKRARLAAFQQYYYKTLPSSRPAQEELRERVVEHLLKDHAASFVRDGSILTDAHRSLQWDLQDAGIEPLLQLSDIIEEDFMLIEQVDAGLCITAASNAYSSSGRIVASVGENLHAAHQLVPGLNEKLGPRIDRVVGTVHEGMPSERFNWQLTPLSTLFFPHDAHAANHAAMERVSETLKHHPERAGELLWLRVERQTLSRLPQSRAIAFSLHTFSDPLSSLKSDPQGIKAMLALLRQYSPERWRYAEMDVVREAILFWLETAAGSV